jgi:site-specific recombinase XerD
LINSRKEGTLLKVIHTGLPGRSDRPLSEFVQDFLADMRIQGKSKSTLRIYGADLERFALWFRGDVGAVTLAILKEYLRGLEGLAPATRARHRVSLRAFFRWAAEAELVSTSPAERLPKVSVPEAQPRALRPGDVARVLASIPDKRDRLIFQLMADAGLRVSEALSIRLERIRLDAQELTVLGKGNRERTAYLIRTEALGLLKRYLRAQGWLDRDGESITAKGLLFRPMESKQRSGKAGEPLHYTTVQARWKKYCRAAKVEATIHQLRHSYATRLINEGKPLEVVQKLLGHRNPQTTQRYAAVSDGTVRRALEGT